MSDIKLRMSAYGSVELTGEGDDIKLRFSASRKTRTGQYVGYDVQLELGRFQIQKLLRQVATMHRRDRRRLERELSRIDSERNAIDQPEADA
jgi:hypothetical protein